MTPLAPWHTPTSPHPRDKQRRALWFARAAFWTIATIIAAIVWSMT